MNTAEWLVGKLANPYSPSSLGYRARTLRMEALLEWFPGFRDMHVVDLGGDSRFWKASKVRPARVTIVTTAVGQLSDVDPWVSIVQADACDFKAVTGVYDLAFSNSVIEHVGGPRYRRGFAETVHALAPRHWVQTPYRYFPLEPHFLIPGFQFLPPVAKVAISSRWPLGAGRGRADPVAYVMDHELLSATEMRSLFPRSELLRERWAGLTKSLIAIG